MPDFELRSSLTAPPAASITEVRLFMLILCSCKSPDGEGFRPRSACSGSTNLERLGWARSLPGPAASHVVRGLLADSAYFSVAAATSAARTAAPRSRRHSPQGFPEIGVPMRNARELLCLDRRDPIAYHCPSGGASAKPMSRKASGTRGGEKDDGVGGSPAIPARPRKLRNRARGGHRLDRASRAAEIANARRRAVAR